MVWGKIQLWYFRGRLKNIGRESINKNNDETTKMKDGVDEILDKLNDSGWESLTIQEEEFLTNASKRLFDERSPN